MPASEEQLPTGDAKRHMVRDMFDRIAPRYDLLNRLLTFRMDVRWRRRTIAELALPKGSLVADLACGTGDFVVELSRQGHSPIGYDLSLEMLRHARADNSLVHCDVTALPASNASLDAAVCGFALRNVVDLEAFFVEIARVVRPSGRIGLLEVASPSNAILRAGHQLYFNKLVPKLGALLSDRKAYEYLPKSVEYLPEAAELTAMLEAVGFSDVKHTTLSGGVAQLFTASR